MHERDLTGELLGQPLVVGVDKRHQLAPRFFEPAVPCRRFAAVGSEDVPHTAEAASNVGRSVCRPVVDDDDLEVPELCASTERIARARNASALYAGMMTLTAGIER